MTSSLLREVFPGRDGHTHLYKRWAICEQLHQHVQALHNVYVSTKVNGMPRQGSEYQRLVRDDAW